MKKAFIALLFLPFGILPVTSYGQISSGTIIVGGGLNYNNSDFHNKSDNSNYKTRNFSVSPSVGIFITQNLAVGAGLGLNTQKQNGGSGVQYKAFGYSFGPFVRYYKFIGEKTAIYGNAAFEYGKVTGKTRHNEADYVPANEEKNLGASFTPGLTYFATPKIALEISLGSVGFYSKESKNNLNTYSYEQINNSGFGTNFGLNNAALGIRFYLARQ